ncbi:MAG TPA: hypothetical protein PKK80_04200 [Bacilli bacterium]|nr:hypothetical protein [Bacilli bacterium]HQA85927.1 hypothetical protein [Erysipelotrichaceae bacterium]
MKKEKELYLVMSAFAGSYLDERDKKILVMKILIFSNHLMMKDTFYGLIAVD